MSYEYGHEGTTLGNDAVSRMLGLTMNHEHMMRPSAEQKHGTALHDISALRPGESLVIAKGGESTPQPSPQVATVGESKPPAKEGGGYLGRVPNRQMDATDAAIVRGERADIAILLAAERRAWNAYASELAHQVIRETLAALGAKP